MMETPDDSKWKRSPGEHGVEPSRSGPKVSLIAFVVVIVLAVIFFFQNSEQTTVTFLFFDEQTAVRSA
ncbi:MAG: hypothetical protein JWM12_2098, partial [Ilumatobacteraceae bacterium]|nr:hypothetical protein [Ilumatobacteraceae bacterium]